MSKSDNDRLSTYPKVFCPECAAELDTTCMKFNDTDNGEYYENWQCYRCCCRFTAVYEGKDDLSDYTIQPELDR